MNFKKFFRSFGYAGRGLLGFLKKEQNIKVQLFIGFLAVLLGFWVGLSSAHWIVVVFLVFLVTGLEIVNSLIEEIADILNLPYHKTTFLRDLSAGMVLWFSLMSAIIGIIVFAEYF
jgi:diacylglycerol kinase